MIIAMTVTCLFCIVALATGLSLLDSWMQARAAFWGVFRQQQLLEAGFIPQVVPDELRLRQPLHRTARRTPEPRLRKRGFAGARRSKLGVVQALR